MRVQSRVSTRRLVQVLVLMAILAIVVNPELRV
jgi:hypothetical protein